MKEMKLPRKRTGFRPPSNYHGVARVAAVGAL
jgi:hypothetical protein